MPRRRVIILNLPNSSDEIALIESRTPKPRYPMRKRGPNRWTLEEKRQYVTFRNQNKDMPLEDIQKYHYPNKTTSSLSWVYTNEMNKIAQDKKKNPNEEVAAKAAATSLGKRKPPGKQLAENDSYDDESTDPDNDNYISQSGEFGKNESPAEKRQKLSASEQHGTSSSEHNATPSLAPISVLRHPFSLSLPSLGSSRAWTAPTADCSSAVSPTQGQLRGYQSASPTFTRPPKRFPASTNETNTPLGNGIDPGTSTENITPDVSKGSAVSEDIVDLTEGEDPDRLPGNTWPHSDATDTASKQPATSTTSQQYEEKSTKESIPRKEIRLFEDVKNGFARVYSTVEELEHLAEENRKEISDLKDQIMTRDSVIDKLTQDKAKLKAWGTEVFKGLMDTAGKWNSENA